MQSASVPSLSLIVVQPFIQFFRRFGTVFPIRDRHSLLNSLEVVLDGLSIPGVVLVDNRLLFLTSFPTYFESASPEYFVAREGKKTVKEQAADPSRGKDHGERPARLSAVGS